MMSLPLEVANLEGAVAVVGVAVDVKQATLVIARYDGGEGLREGLEYRGGTRGGLSGGQHGTSPWLGAVYRMIAVLV